MPLFFQHLILWVEASKYFLLFVGAIFEGPVLMMTSGFLFRLGEFHFWPMYLALLSGDLLADVGWYFIGYYGASPIALRITKVFGVTPDIIHKIELRFRQHQTKILFISKVTMGFGFALATLMVAGIFKVPLKRYILINFLGGLIWTLFLLVVGYFLGNIYQVIIPELRIVFLCIMVTGMIVGLHFITKYIRKIEL